MKATAEQLLEEAKSLLKAAGIKAWEKEGQHIRYYDPRKGNSREAYCTLAIRCYGKHRFVTYEASCGIRKGGPSGAFCSKMAEVLKPSSDAALAAKAAETE